MTATNNVKSMLPCARLVLALTIASITNSHLYAIQEDTASSMILGVNTHLRHWNNEDIPAMVADAGFTWIRDDFYWHAFEKEKGVYTMPEAYSFWIDKANEAGLKVLAIFNGSNPLYAPEIYDADAYARAAAEFAKATKGRVHAIEILNEPANFGYTKHYGGTWNGYHAPTGEVDHWVAEYVELLNKAAKAIKDVNPEVKVIGLGSVSPVNFRQLKMGIAPEVDGLVDHPYSFRLPPEVIPYSDNPAILARDGITVADEEGSFASLIKNYRELSHEYDGPGEIWLTEWGWTTYQESKAGKHMYAPVTELTQAKYTLRRLYEALGTGVYASFIYDFMDDGRSAYNAEENFGLLTVDGEPKPVLEAIRLYVDISKQLHPINTSDNEKVRIIPAVNRPDQHPIKWDDAKLEALNAVVCYSFSTAGDNTAVAYWSAERVSGELKPMLGKFILETPRQLESILAVDTLTGERKQLTFSQEDGHIVVSHLEIPDYPTVLILKYQ